MDKQKLLRLLETGGTEQVIVHLITEFQDDQQISLQASKAIYDKIEEVKSMIKALFICNLVTILLCVLAVIF